MYLLWKIPWLEVHFLTPQRRMLLTQEKVKTIVNDIWPFYTDIFISLVCDLHLEYLFFVLWTYAKVSFFS